MTLNEISNVRLLNQKIVGSGFRSPDEIVRWMGAMQAQDFSMAKWALGLRLVNSTEKNITDAFNKGEILRTHLMRPTWHFVSPDDIYWLLKLTAPQIKTSLKTRHRNLELSEEIVRKSLKLIEKVLYKENNKTREELNSVLNKEKIRTDENRLSHILLLAELEGVICSGAVRGNKITYSLLSERVSEKITFTREESLAELACRYFSSHYPATLSDYSWWSGLSLSDARKGLELVRDDFHFENIDQEKYWLPNSFSAVESLDPTVVLLPAYDEFLISYRNRKAALSLMDQKRVVSTNGIFWPTIVNNGQVTGLWKKSTRNNTVLVEADLIQQDEHTERLIAEEIKHLSLFWDKPADLIIRTG